MPKEHNDIAQTNPITKWENVNLKTNNLIGTEHYTQRGSLKRKDVASRSSRLPGVPPCSRPFRPLPPNSNPIHAHSISLSFPPPSMKFSTLHTKTRRRTPYFNATTANKTSSWDPRSGPLLDEGLGQKGIHPFSQRKKNANPLFGSSPYFPYIELICSH